MPYNPQNYKITQKIEKLLEIDSNKPIPKKMQKVWLTHPFDFYWTHENENTSTLHWKILTEKGSIEQHKTLTRNENHNDFSPYICLSPSIQEDTKNSIIHCKHTNINMTMINYITYNHKVIKHDKIGVIWSINQCQTGDLEFYFEIQCEICGRFFNPQLKDFINDLKLDDKMNIIDDFEESELTIYEKDFLGK